MKYVSGVGVMSWASVESGHCSRSTCKLAQAAARHVTAPLSEVVG